MVAMGLGGLSSDLNRVFVWESFHQWVATLLRGEEQFPLRLQIQAGSPAFLREGDFRHGEMDADAIPPPPQSAVKVGHPHHYTC